MTAIAKFRDKEGRFGCYTDAYHRLFDGSAWVVIRRCAARSITEGDLAVAFSQFGEVVDVRCPRSRRTGDVVGNCVFVEFAREDSARLAADNMNSGRGPAGIKVYLTAECEAKCVGLEVDRCSLAEVPPLAPGTVSYGQWYASEMLGKDFQRSH